MATDKAAAIPRKTEVGRQSAACKPPGTRYSDLQRATDLLAFSTPPEPAAVNRYARYVLLVVFCSWLAYRGWAPDVRPPAERPANKQRAEPRPRVAPSTITGKVVSIADGDTLQISAAEQVTVRLEGIDTPERGQPYGNQARRHLSDLCYGKTATVAVLGEDQFGRSLGIVTIDGQDINSAMVRDGFAWRYLHSNDKELARLEAEARRERRGLWQDRDPTPPWIYRRENPRTDR